MHAYKLKEIAEMKAGRIASIPGEISRLEKYLFRTAELGQLNCSFFVENEVDDKDPVVIALKNYLDENKFRYETDLHYECIGFHHEVMSYFLKIRFDNAS